jgi:hypothetical protein
LCAELVDAYKRLAKERNDFKAKIEERDKEDEAILNADVGLAPPPPEDDDRPNATDAAESNGAGGNDVESELAKQLGSGQVNGEQQQSGDDDNTEPSGSVNDAKSGDDGGMVYQIDEEEREKEARRKELERQREAAYQARLRELVREGHVLRRTVREAREQAAEKERALVGRVEELEQRVQEQKDLYDTLQTKSGEQIERLATELQRKSHCHSCLLDLWPLTHTHTTQGWPTVRRVPRPKWKPGTRKRWMSWRASWPSRGTPRRSCSRPVSGVSR